MKKKFLLLHVHFSYRKYVFQLFPNNLENSKLNDEQFGHFVKKVLSCSCHTFHSIQSANMFTSFFQNTPRYPRNVSQRCKCLPPPTKSLQGYPFCPAQLCFKDIQEIILRDLDVYQLFSKSIPGYIHFIPHKYGSKKSKRCIKRN